MDLLVILNATNLPDLSGIETWGKTVVVQFITIVVMFIAAKHVMKLKLGGVLAVCCVGGAVTWIIQHWSKFSGWIEGFMNGM
ncbi:hypothetical protein QUF79_03160 [Fictibacillus enclensis]|uniref:hypothetical protein n=1 Tax=Fictibacillus enclensis TaxID=1017270 RepID=UPI0025A30EE9|nr:hypothetical protein [Fictibacillus enclensis]MDM5197032.1 hypothetical protein [Fictibacillus enclensis]